LVISHRSQITLAGVACALVAWVAPARAHNVDCRKSETQAECHARLKCKANEELEDCQKRLLRCTANESLDECKKRAAAQSQGNGGQQDEGDRNRDRGDDERSGRDRDTEERSGRDNEDRDRGDRGDHGDRDRGDRGGDDSGRRERGGGGGGDRGRRRRGGGGGGGFEANKTFGLGLELGEPTGLNGKYFVSPKAALDFGVGYIYRNYYYSDGLHLYGDFLFHPTSLVHADAFELPFYIGGGLRYWAFDYCVNGACTSDSSAIGIRIPIGISFDFNNVPLDIFIQVVPTIDFVRGDYYRRNGRNHIAADFSVGIRFWFK